MKNSDDNRLLDHKRKIDAERKQRAIERAAQQRLRDTTPGTATPASVMNAMFKARMKKGGLVL